MERNKGISLIVLVITIIVMIILAGAIILSLNNAGIINKANEAVGLTNATQLQEMVTAELMLNGWHEGKQFTAMDATNLEERLDASVVRVGTNALIIDKDGTKITCYATGNVVVGAGWAQDGTTVTNGTWSLTVGDTIDYVATGSNYNGTWSVLGADKGELLIISTDNVVDKFELSGKEGYTGGAAAITAACSSYGAGAKATGVRSIEIEDIDRIVKYEKTTFDYLEFYTEGMEKNGQTVGELSEATKQEMKVFNYGITVTYSWNGTTKPVATFKADNKTIALNSSTEYQNGFIWYDETSKTWKTSIMTANASATNLEEITTITGNMYAYYIDEQNPAYNLLIATSKGNREYWLASPLCITQLGGLALGIRSVYDGWVYGDGLCGSAGAIVTSSRGIRAVVSLSSDIQLTGSSASGWSY